MMTRAERVKASLFTGLAAALSFFVLSEVNYPLLTPQSELAIFALFGFILIVLQFPLAINTFPQFLLRWLDIFLIAIVTVCFGYVVVQSEPGFSAYWLDGQPLGNRAGSEQFVDYFVGLLGLLAVLEATRRTIGMTLPLLSLAFIAYAAFGAVLPDWLFPHRGYEWQRIVSQTFLHSQGVFGVALNVMFTYVFLFVLFGTLLEVTGATGFILQTAKRWFRHSAGGPAKVAVISSGAMGSLSGSAVANAATTGTFTIPLMKSIGMRPHVAAGIEAAASSGGALMPPVMGAGAYMMLEIIDPPVTYLEVIKAALIPAVLYYLALLLIVHFHSQRRQIGLSLSDEELSTPPRYQGVVFLAAFVTLIGFLVIGYTPFRAVSVSLVSIILLSMFSAATRIGIGGIIEAMSNAARSGVALIAAASCVGIIIGVVTLTGIGSKLPGVLLPLAQNSLVLALLVLMVATIILGMGLPSAVCYLLVATLVGPVLGNLGVVPLAAHLFIFYFGMMSMVTPPVALAAYTTAAIAGAGIMQSGFAAFRFSLVGFALPFAFVLQPELLMLTADGGHAGILAIAAKTGFVVVATIALAAGIAGFMFAPLRVWQRALLLAGSGAIFFTRSGAEFLWLESLAVGMVFVLGTMSWRQSKKTMDAGK